MDIIFYNTLHHKKEIFKPIRDKKVGLYTCGPTVYNYAHIGNLRTYIFEDILKRVLYYNNYKVKHVMNITDVGHLTSNADTGEDKIIKAIKREGKKMTVKSMLEIADFYTKAFRKDLKRLNIIEPDIWCKATKNVKDMIKMIRKIEKNGFAYETSDGIYFDTAKLPDYGKLANLDIKGLKEGARVEKNPEKRNPTDFALWFKAVGKNKYHLMQWNSPWGKGWPGWHIECSTMSTKYLGQPFDIHTGGVDHIPVHHTNEIAQCEAAEKKPMANFWLHGEFLLLDKEKMAKTGGLFITLQTLIDRGFNPLAYRYLCLTTHYRSQLNFSWESLKSAQNALDNLYAIISGYKKISRRGLKEFEQKFLEAINNDLDTPKALAIIWEMIKSKLPEEKKLNSLFKFDKILGLKLKENWRNSRKIPKKIKNLIILREKYRQEKNWNKADEIREKVKKLGYSIEDTTHGPLIKKIVKH